MDQRSKQLTELTIRVTAIMGQLAALLAQEVAAQQEGGAHQNPAFPQGSDAPLLEREASG